MLLGVLLAGMPLLPAMGQLQELVEQPSVLAALEEELSGLYCDLRPSLVQVQYTLAPEDSKEQTDKPTYLIVSGVVVGDSGFLLAPSPPADLFSSVSVVTQEGKRVSADPIRRETLYGFSLLFSNEIGVRGIPLRDRRDPLLPGTVVVSLGNGFGLEASLGLGFISGTHRQVGERPGLLQITNAIYPGDGGGLLADRDGKLVGLLLSSMQSSSPSEKDAAYSAQHLASSVGFAVPIQRLIDAFPHQLGALSNARQLGVFAYAQPKDEAGNCFVFRVHSVDKGSVGDRAGLLPNDIMLGIGDVQEFCSIDDFLNAIQSAPVRSVLRVWRDGNELVLLLDFSDKKEGSKLRPFPEPQ